MKRSDHFYYNIRKGLRLHTLYDRLRDGLRFMFRQWPVRRDSTQFTPPPFFIIGSGRSGNTLLRAILTGHEDIAIPPESYVLGKAVRHFRAYSYQPWKILVKLVLAEFEYHPQFIHWDVSLRDVCKRALKIPREQRDLAYLINEVYVHYSREHMPQSVRWGDKTPVNTLHADWIDCVFPEARYVHILRDGRDVVNSYLQAGIYSSVDEATDRWGYSIMKARRFGRQHPQRYLEVRYESLVSSPEAEVKRICRFLEIEFRDKMLNVQDRTGELGDAHLTHHRGLQRPINTDSIGKWKKTLPMEDQQRVQDRIAKLLRELGYQ